MKALGGLLTAALVLASTGAGADDVEVRHGQVRDGRTDLSFETGVTGTFQHASDPRVGDEFQGSLDLVATLPMGPGVWTLYVEGSSSTAGDGVSARIPEANGDAGSALNGDGKGRLQVSELHYEWMLGGGSLTLGLIDPTGFLDASEVANDETRQFLGTTLVNDPAIEFPDYTLGAVWHQGREDDALHWTLLVAGSHGLADGDGTYGALFDLGAAGKGAFVATEAAWTPEDTTWRLGAWIHTAAHPHLDGTPGSAANRGLYAVADGALGKARWNLRAGLADPRVSAVANFVGIAVERPLASATLGLGLTRSGPSNHLGSGAAATWQGEIYTRFHLAEGLHLTPDIQWVRHTGLGGPPNLDTDALILGVRLSYELP